MNKKSIIIILTILFSLTLTVSAATLKGSIYNDRLQLEKDTLIQINTVPEQKYLAKDGSYSFELSIGKYQLKAKRGVLETTDEINIVEEGTYTFDLFLLPDFKEEDELWNDTNEIYLDDTEVDQKTNIFAYIIAGIILLFAIFRIRQYKKKYGSLKQFRKRIQEESKKTPEQIKEELAKEPGYIENALEIINKNDGRISQKELRKEMLYLSEAKISLILTELEHKGKIEKIKKGRGNIIISKENQNETKIE